METPIQNLNLESGHIADIMPQVISDGRISPVNEETTQASRFNQIPRFGFILRECFIDVLEIHFGEVWRAPALKSDLDEQDLDYSIVDYFGIIIYFGFLIISCSLVGVIVESFRNLTYNDNYSIAAALVIKYYIIFGMADYIASVTLKTLILYIFKSRSSLFFICIFQFFGTIVGSLSVALLSGQTVLTILKFSLTFNSLQVPHSYYIKNTEKIHNYLNLTSSQQYFIYLVLTPMYAILSPILPFYLAFPSYNLNPFGSSAIFGFFGLGNLAFIVEKLP